MKQLSEAILPLILLLVSLLLLFPKKDLFSAFLEGATDGLRSCVQLFPTLVVLLTAVGAFTASGAADALALWLAPACQWLGIPAELVPLLLVRPVSGSGATALAADLFARYGADSFAGLCASVLMGCSDTVIYICAIYYGGIGVRYTRHTLPAALLTMCFCIFFSCCLVRLFLG